MSDRVKIRQWIPAYNCALDAHVALQWRRDAVRAFAAGIDCEAKIAHGCDLQQMRNEAFRQAMDDGVDYLFMQDSDTSSPHPDGPLMPMLETLRHTRAAAVFAIVTLRNMGGRANVWPVHAGKVYELEKAGTGMLIIDMNKVRPWYKEYPGPMFFNLYEDKTAQQRAMGMDVFFCKMMRSEIEGIKPSLKLVCDGRIPTRHVNAVYALNYDGEQDPSSDGATVEAGKTNAE